MPPVEATLPTPAASPPAPPVALAVIEIVLPDVMGADADNCETASPALPALLLVAM